MTIDGIPYTLHGQQRLIFSALFNARGRGLSTAELIDALYGDDEGPGDPLSVLWTVMHRLRGKLAQTRFRIVKERHWRYRMVRITPEGREVAPGASNAVLDGNQAWV